MRQAIVTKYLGPTNFRGSRVKATCQAGSVTVPYSYSANGNDAAHAVAVLALLRKFDWTGRWAPGGLPDGTGNAYVQVPDSDLLPAEVLP